MKKPAQGSSHLLSALMAFAVYVPLSVHAVDDSRVSICFNDWPPYAILNDGAPEGISINIIRRAGQMLGREIDFVELKWRDCLQKVADGELDAVVDAAMRPEYLQGPTSFSLFTDTFWVRDDSPIHRYADMRDGAVGLVEGYNYIDSLHRHLQKLKLRVTYEVDDPANIRQLARGEVDTIVADLASTFVYARQHDLKIHPILPPFSVDRLYLSFNSGKTELQREFDRSFASLLEQGYVDSIYQQYIGTSFSSFVIEQ